MSTGNDADQRDATEEHDSRNNGVEDYDVHDRERSESYDMPAVDAGTAATSVWYLWVVAVVTAVVAGFFATSTVVTTPAEPFYALIFGGVAVMAAGYGFYTVRERTRPF
ncbi:hypothetical protein [Halococcus salifodinae]|nr:hypothetical protein [Halococcus salifodinae]